MESMNLSSYIFQLCFYVLFHPSCRRTYRITSERIAKGTLLYLLKRFFHDDTLTEIYRIIVYRTMFMQFEFNCAIILLFLCKKERF